MATIKDVAKDAGVSIATVSHVINGTRRVSDELAQRVRASMAKLDYRPDSVARSLRTQRTHSIGLIISDISNPFFSVLARGAQDTAAEFGYSVIMCNTDEDPNKERLYLDLFRQRRMDGLLIAPVGNTSENLGFLTASRIPFVFVDRRISGVEAPAVLSTNVEGARTATQHLIEYGHTRIGIILGLEGTSTNEERYRGYQEALREAGLAEQQNLTVRGDFRVSGGIQCSNALLDLPEPPTAIFSLNNLTAIGVLCAIRERGLSFPEDVSVISFDSPWWMDRVISPALTCIKQKPYVLGQEGMKRLISRIESDTNVEPAPVPSVVRIPTEFHVGESVRDLRGSHGTSERDGTAGES